MLTPSPDLRNAASAGKRAVRAEHMTADTRKKGEEELDTTFKATQVGGGREKGWGRAVLGRGRGQEVGEMMYSTKRIF